MDGENTVSGGAIGMLKRQEAGVKTADVCSKHGISAATFATEVNLNGKSAHPA